MNTSLNFTTLHRYIDELGAMKNTMIIVVKFGWMSEIIIFDVSYVKDIDFFREKLRALKIVILRSMMSKMNIFNIQWSRMTKIIISGYSKVKDNNNQFWKLMDVKDNYCMPFVLGRINRFDITIPST